VIESVQLVVAALAAGAAAGAGETASTAVRDAYEGLKSLTHRALRRSEPAKGEGAVLDAWLGDPVTHQEQLAAMLSAPRVEVDDELVAAARRVLELAAPEGESAAKYRVTLRHNKVCRWETTTRKQHVQLTMA
jgi:hypothetical protein